jgi:hypothetical protein
MSRQTKSGRKATNQRGELQEIKVAISKAHTKKFGKQTYIDRLDRKKRNL